MEFHEKLQELRKQRGLTQEELAQALYVTRPAVSKWESGRGYPSLDSLKAIAAFFSVSIDQLLSGDQVLTIAQEDTRQVRRQIRDRVVGALDLSTGLLLFLPFFGQSAGDWVRAVSLLALAEPAPLLRGAYLATVTAMALLGLLRLALGGCARAPWEKHKDRLSLLLNGAGTLLFIISPQPYAASFLFLLLSIKVLLLGKQP